MRLITNVLLLLSLHSVRSSAPQQWIVNKDSVTDLSQISESTRNILQQLGNGTNEKSRIAWEFEQDDIFMTYATAAPTISSAPTTTAVPSDAPTISAAPTMLPSTFPSHSPSQHPSDYPSVLPSTSPSDRPTDRPSQSPSQFPSQHPSDYPTVLPSRAPSARPTSKPSQRPSHSPSQHPTVYPSVLPSASPSNRPTDRPSESPSQLPSQHPSDYPSDLPSVSPSDRPTDRPSLTPSQYPSQHPSDYPSVLPSTSPSDRPTDRPSLTPSQFPSQHPSDYPTVLPSRAPSARPTSKPSQRPSHSPSQYPSDYPSVPPSISPSNTPTSKPSVTPSQFPSDHPTLYPSVSPSTWPSDEPTSRPSLTPSQYPSDHPSRYPSIYPSLEPSSTPSVFPSDKPSQSPSNPPTDQPSPSPTNFPTVSVAPSSTPTISMAPSLIINTTPITKFTIVLTGPPDSEPVDTNVVVDIAREFLNDYFEENLPSYLRYRGVELNEVKSKGRRLQRVITISCTGLVRFNLFASPDIVMINDHVANAFDSDSAFFERLKQSDNAGLNSLLGVRANQQPTVNTGFSSVHMIIIITCISLVVIGVAASYVWKRTQENNVRKRLLRAAEHTHQYRGQPQLDDECFKDIEPEPIQISDDNKALERMVMRARHDRGVMNRANEILQQNAEARYDIPYEDSLKEVKFASFEENIEHDGIVEQRRVSSIDSDVGPLFKEGKVCSSSCGDSSLSPLSREESVATDSLATASVATASVATDANSLIHLGYNDIESGVAPFVQAHRELGNEIDTRDEDNSLAESVASSAAESILEGDNISLSRRNISNLTDNEDMTTNEDITTTNEDVVGTEFQQSSDGEVYFTDLCVRKY